MLVGGCWWVGVGRWVLVGGCWWVGVGGRRSLLVGSCSVLNRWAVVV